MSQRVIELPLGELRSRAAELRAGDRVVVSGMAYTARDAAHKAMFQCLERGDPLPFDVRGAVIYYAGPTPAKGEWAVGSCGPTTSGRMDAFAPGLYDMGLAATIGKGERSEAVRLAIVRNRAVYLCAVGGAGALIARHITSAAEIAYGELGCESIKRITVERLPLTVAIDSSGGDIFSARFR
ncbi:MAG: FumA C-terminus/TtdB family hydratase beta subunit [Oscillospiraceae bacterium]|jgi:fumarate hydratase subunit beta|nr:FumA C-terminus/TtdB family hydratase beta subunit [Oscillospiraceae bacterium]